MVGKSNKFDFSNRGNSGTNLAQVVSDAFEKELEKAKKDAARQAKKIIKSGTSVEASKDISVHIIDMKLPHKELGDRGIEIMVIGMDKALSHGSAEASLSLQHVNLRDNSLTAHGCSMLANTLYHCRASLKTLDLSNNQISVDTEEDLTHWDNFITRIVRYHRSCEIDLSGNTKLGSKAWEVFARAAAHENVHRACRYRGVLHMVGQADLDPSLLAIDFEDDEAVERSRHQISSIPSEAYLVSGLPTLYIADTGLDDAGALWLSYLLPASIHADQLNTAVTVECDEKTPSSSPHVEWQIAGASVGKDGLQLLRWVEEISSRATEENAHNEARTTTTKSLPRRISGRHSLTSEINAADVLALRHKMQRSIIQQLGVKHVQLWRAALACVKISRQLLLKSSPVARKHRRITSTASDTLKLDVKWTGKQPSPQTAPRVLRITASPQTIRATNGHAHGSLLADVSNRQTRSSSTTNHNGHTDAAGAMTARMSSLVLTSTNRYIDWQQNLLTRRPYRDATAVCGLPTRVFRRICAATVQGVTDETFNHVQWDRMYHWGQDRSTLTVERDWIKMTESAQILTLLDSVMCLAYVL